MSVGEFIYDNIMINPTVVHGLDFARTEDLSSLFTLSQFSSHIDTITLTGDMAQLKGYGAEQMAEELHLIWNGVYSSLYRSNLYRSKEMKTF